MSMRDAWSLLPDEVYFNEESFPTVTLTSFDFLTNSTLEADSSHGFRSRWYVIFNTTRPFHFIYPDSSN